MDIKSKLARLFFPYGSIQKVLRGTAKGLKFVVEPGLGVTYALGTEIAAPKFFQEFVRPDMLVFDIGANKGQMALLFSRLVGPGGKVVSLEPAQIEFSSLVRNIELNNLNNILALEAAAANQAGRMEFLYSSEAPTQGKLASTEPEYQVEDTESFSVSSVTLDALAEQHGMPDFVKLDIEGGAAVALQGASTILTQGNPVLYIELHGPEERAGVVEEILGRNYMVYDTLGNELTDDPELWPPALVAQRS